MAIVPVAEISVESKEEGFGVSFKDVESFTFVDELNSTSLMVGNDCEGCEKGDMFLKVRTSRPVEVSITGKLHKTQMEVNQFKGIVTNHYKQKEIKYYQESNQEYLSVNFEKETTTMFLPPWVCEPNCTGCKKCERNDDTDQDGERLTQPKETTTMFLPPWVCEPDCYNDCKKCEKNDDTDQDGERLMRTKDCSDGSCFAGKQLEDGRG